MKQCIIQNIVIIQLPPKLFYTCWVDSWEKTIVSRWIAITYLSTLHQLADILVSEKTDTYETVKQIRKDLFTTFSTEKPSKGEVLTYQRGKVMAIK